MGSVTYGDDIAVAVVAVEMRRIVGSRNIVQLLHLAGDGGFGGGPVDIVVRQGQIIAIVVFYNFILFQCFPSREKKPPE